jgi:hypothetical protein
VSLTAFSQSGTRITSDTSIICFTKSQAKEITKDLLRKDSLEVENKLLWKNSDILNNQIRLRDASLTIKDSLIDVKNKLIDSKDKIIAIKDQEIQLHKEQTELTKQALKKQKNKTLIGNLTSGLIVTGLIILLAVN